MGVAVRMLEVGWWGIIKGSLQKHLKTGWVKAKVVHRGEGVLKESPPLPPPENFNHTLRPYHLCKTMHSPKSITQKRYFLCNLTIGLCKICSAANTHFHLRI